VVIDTSAIIAILMGEAEAQTLASAISKDSKRFISVISLLEASIVIEAKKGEEGGRELDLLLHRANIEPVAMDLEMGRIARDAWRSFGKGRHPAGLNIGDCCAYALASYLGEPILYKGDDFSKADIPAVL
jgi:ribonuclease VapC